MCVLLPWSMNHKNEFGGLLYFFLTNPVPGIFLILTIFALVFKETSVCYGAL